MATIIKVTNRDGGGAGGGGRSQSFKELNSFVRESEKVTVRVRNSFPFVHKLWKVVRYKSFNKQGQRRNTHY